MFKLNLKIAWRNLWKNKVYSAINIFGLAAGLAGFMIILLYINKETGFDKWNSDLERTYIAAADFTKNGARNKGSKIKALLSKVIDEQINEVEVVSIGNISGRLADVRIPGQEKTIAKQLEAANVDSNFFKVYPLKPLYGRMQDIEKDAFAVAISYTAATEIFGTADVVNKVLTWNVGVNFPETNLVIKAVWDDRDQPSSFGFNLLFKENLEEYGNQLLSTTFTTIFKLKENVDATKTIQKINDAYIVELAKMEIGNSDASFKPSKSQALQVLAKNAGITTFKLITTPIADLNLSDFYTSNPKGTTINILIALASFLIIISCINYANLALVLAQTRAKEVGVKKALGAFRWGLIRQFFTETAIQCVFSFLLALMLAELILPRINQILTENLVLFSSGNISLIFGQVVLILIAIILLSGAYPAIVLAGFLPARVLKGNFSTSTHIGKVRKGLMVFQFTVAIALVISFGVIYAQLSFMKQKDLGLMANQIMSVGIAKHQTRKLNPDGFSFIKNRLLAINGVEAVTRATEQPINDSGFEDDISFNNTTLSVEARYVDANYFETIGGEILKGRSFSDKMLGTDSVQSIILNETAFKKLGLTQENTAIDIVREDTKVKLNVIGIVKDIQAHGFTNAIMPTAYLVGEYSNYFRRNVIFRLNTTNLKETTAAIKTVWSTIDPGADPKFVFVDEVFAKMNHSYEVSSEIIFSFGMVTLIISVFGLIGFAAFNAKMRIKEIAVRKILGATTVSLLKLLNLDFVKLVLVAMVLADSIAYIYMQKWFNTFAYRIDMPFIVFGVVNLTIILITILTVSLQSIRAVNENPVKALKHE